jgi:predicted transcriptional regulator
MTDSKFLSVHLSSVVKPQFDHIAPTFDRPRNGMVNRTVEDDAAAQAWQLGEIQRGLAEAEAGDFAKPGEIKAAFAAFRRPRRRAG